MTEIQKRKQKQENILKLKKIGFWIINITCYICTFLFVLLLIISLSTPKQSNTTPRNVSRSIHNVNEIQLVDHSPNGVSFDDSSYTISFTSNELNENSFTELGEYFNELNLNDELYSFLLDTTIIYDSNTYYYDSIAQYSYDSYFIELS